MSVKHQVDAKTLGKRYAELVRERGLPVKGLWVRDVSGTPELWIVVEHLDLHSERPVHQAIVDLQRTFPDSLFEDRVINPAWIPDFQITNVVPPDARKVAIRR